MSEGRWGLSSFITGASAELSLAVSDAYYLGISQFSNLFTVDVILSGPELEPMSPFSIYSMSRICDYHGAYMDDLVLVVEMHPVALLHLIDHMRDLTCTMVMRSHDIRTGEEIMDLAPVVKEYIAVISDSEDLRKKVSLLKYSPGEDGVIDEKNLSARVEVRLSLYSKYVYEKRLISVNGILGPDVTIDNALNYLVNAFGVVDRRTDKADNPYHFKQIIIPPVHGLSTAFHYLQDQYGVYSKGLGNYFFEDIFFLFRPYDTAFVSPYTLHLLVMPQARIKDMEVTGGITKEHDLMLIVTHPPEVVNLTEKGAENLGTLQTQIKTDQLIDHAHTVHKDGKVVLSQASNTMTVGSTNKLSSSVSQHMKYRGSTTNPFTASSAMAATQVVAYKVTVDKAIYLPIHPNMSVKVHYDNSEGRYTVSKGVVVAVGYHLIRVPSVIGNEVFYQMEMSIQCLLTPDEYLMR